jgi:hypothetical protein
MIPKLSPVEHVLSAYGRPYSVDDIVNVYIIECRGFTDDNISFPSCPANTNYTYCVRV